MNERMNAHVHGECVLVVFLQTHIQCNIIQPHGLTVSEP